MHVWCKRVPTRRDGRLALVDRAPALLSFFFFSLISAGDVCVFVHGLDKLSRQMYMDRTCPVVAWWLAPHGYSPATFVDTLTGRTGRSPPAPYLFVSTPRTLEKVADPPPPTLPPLSAY